MKVISQKKSKEKGLISYYTGKPCKHGHYSDRLTSNGTCRECNRVSSKANYEKNKEHILYNQKEMYNKNIDLEREKRRDHYKKNKDKYKKRNKEYRENNRELMRESKRIYYINNRDACIERAIKYQKIRYKEKPEYYFIRRSLDRVFTGFSGSEKTVKSQLGYTPDDLREHIESQFEEGMAWENRSEWHIDHIKPISAFLKDGITDPKIINALSNLQPLWAHENLSKGSRWEADHNES